MTAVQVCEQSIKPLSAEDKLTIAQFIIDEVVPAFAASPAPTAGEEYGFEYLKRILPHNECITLTDKDLASVALR